MPMVSEPMELPEFLPSDDGDPVYVQIERWVESLIRTDQLRRGDRLPNERHLAAHVGVSRMTLRQALAALERSGLIRRSPGRNGGAFVAEGQVLVDLSILPGLAAQIRQSRRDPGSVVLVAEMRRAPQAVADALQIADGDAYYIERVRRAGDNAIAMERSWFPGSIAQDFLENDLTGSLYEALASYGRAPVEATEYITPLLDNDCAEMLGMHGDEPLLHVRRTARDSNGVPVEYSNDVFRPDRVQFMVTRRID